MPPSLRPSVRRRRSGAMEIIIKGARQVANRVRRTVAQKYKQSAELPQSTARAHPTPWSCFRGGARLVAGTLWWIQVTPTDRALRLGQLPSIRAYRTGSITGTSKRGLGRYSRPPLPCKIRVDYEGNRCNQTNV